jgi:hypothetical protein
MRDTYRLLVYGSSAWMAGIASGLHGTPGLDVYRLDPRWVDNPVETAAFFAPHIILSERELDVTMTLYAMLQIPVVEIDAAFKVLSIHAARQAPVDSIKELLYILDEIVDASPNSAASPL